MKEGAERRHTREDLELGRQHMLEILEKVVPLIEEGNNRETYEQLIRDIKKTNNAIDLKNLYRDTRRRLEDMVRRTPYTEKGTSPEDTKEVHRLLQELTKIPVDLIED